MIVIKKESFEDKQIDRQIRKLGIANVASFLGVTKQYLNLLLNEHKPIAYRNYLQIKQIVNDLLSQNIT